MVTNYIKVPLQLIRDTNNSSATILSYIRYRLQFNVSFIESNKQIAKTLGMSECGVAKIMRKLKEGGLIGSLCKRHDDVLIGSKEDEKHQHLVKKAYFRKTWLTKKGKSYYE